MKRWKQATRTLAGVLALMGACTPTSRPSVEGEEVSDTRGDGSPAVTPATASETYDGGRPFIRAEVTDLPPSTPAPSEPDAGDGASADASSDG